MLLAVYRLAFLLKRTVGEIASMPMSEFAHWLAYLKLEPPEKGDTERTAALMATITNMAGRSLPDKKMVKPDDFLGRKKRQSMEEQIAFMKGLGRG
jgi:hypothetical protein